MRDYLFRGKRKDNGEWVEGCGIIATENWVSIFTVIDDIDENSSEVNEIEVLPSTVGQYTGLTDKNGKKIFEGDIIKYKNTDGIKFNGVALTVIGKVVYNEKNASFAISGKDEIGAKHYDYFPIKKIEVIGNIHDNPELLK